MSVGTRVLFFFAIALLITVPFAAQESTPVLLSATENAYNPIPSPDGELIAYVLTGWGRNPVIRSFGFRSLRSEIAVMTSSGDVLTRSPLADAFLDGWTSDGNDLICYRDQWLLVSPYGGISRQLQKIDGIFRSSQRASYLRSSGSLSGWNTQNG
jgi:hypothetical protein